MKTIEKDELFDNVRQFLKKKGIELTDGSYSRTIQKSCRIVADVVNMGQQGLERAKNGIDRKLDQVREVIHRRTTPKPPSTAKTAATAPGAGSAAEAAGGPAQTATPPPIIQEPGTGARSSKAKGARPDRKKAARKPTGTTATKAGKAKK
jgi:hypothetical protein